MFGVSGQGGAPRRPRRETPAWQRRPASMSEAAWRAAKLVSALANPMVLCPPCFLAVACKATPRWPDRMRWWAVSCGLITLAPFIHIRWGLRTGRLSDPEITVRQERLIPYAAQIGTLGVTYALLRRLHAPRLIIAIVISVAGAIVVITGVTTVWKMSMHLVGTAGTATVLTLIYGKRALPLVGLIPLVAWSRYVLDHHTPAQALAGAALGAAAPLIVFQTMDPLPRA